MKNNKIILILCLFIILLSLNTLSATNNTINNIQSDDNIIQETTVKQAQENTVYVNSNSENTIEDGNKETPYKTLNNENLEKIATDTTVKVSKGTYDIEPIIINKNLSIIGESTDEVIFIPKSTQTTITILKNANLQLANLTIKDFSSENNAAITNNGTLKIENLNVYNNSGTASNGGSILNNGNLEVINTTFEKNMASFGSAIYSFANVTVRNSTFTDNNISNVGGAIYSAGGNLTVEDSYFTLNRAVSGAAIYSAFGHLYVNNSIFYENDAEHFFGGAIYSTGFALTENSIFELNHAKRDGGAITNTNNFTIINCTFNENYAEELGGAIENVPWSITENGNLTIINSTFYANSATKGGAIINYGKAEAVGETATITARNTVFELNSAFEGGVIYNQQFVDFEDSVFIDNEANEYNVIYSDESLIKSINNNWWGTNNPTVEDIGAKPETWRIVEFTNISPLKNNVELQVTINTLNNNEKTNSSLPERTAVFTAETSEFADNNIKLQDIITNTVDFKDDEITVQVDNQKLTLAKRILTDIKLTADTQTKYNESVTVTGTLTDNEGTPLENKVIKLLFNNGRATVKTDDAGNFEYTYAFAKIGINNVTATFNGDKQYDITSKTLNIETIPQDTRFSTGVKTLVKVGETISINVTLTDIYGNKLKNSTIKLFINNGRKTLKTDQNGTVLFNYTITKIGTYNITVSYLGSNKYNPTELNTTVVAEKLDTKILFDSFNSIKKGDSLTIKGKLVDNYGESVVGTVKLLINNGRATVKTNENGEFEYTYKFNKVGVNNISATYLESNRYTQSVADTTVVVTKAVSKVALDSLADVKKNTNITISGKLTDENGNTVVGTVKLLINNGRATVKTDSNGVFNYNFTVTRVGITNITATYLENDNYLQSNSTVSFNVTKV